MIHYSGSTVERIVITFFTTAEAMATEKACKEAGIEGKLISSPRELTADCGIAYSLSPNDKSKVEALLAEKEITYDKMHTLLTRN